MLDLAYLNPWLFPLEALWGLVAFRFAAPFVCCETASREFVPDERAACPIQTQSIIHFEFILIRNTFGNGVDVERVGQASSLATRRHNR
jgi:hypothetical protein